VQHDEDPRHANAHSGAFSTARPDPGDHAGCGVDGRACERRSTTPPGRCENAGRGNKRDQRRRGEMIRTYDPRLCARNPDLGPSIAEVLTSECRDRFANEVSRWNVGTEQDPPTGLADAVVELVVLVRWVGLVIEPDPLECAPAERAGEDRGEFLDSVRVAVARSTDAEW
jgi:hypothetical protein